MNRNWESLCFIRVLEKTMGNHDHFEKLTQIAVYRS